MEPLPAEEVRDRSSGQPHRASRLLFLLPVVLLLAGCSAMDVPMQFTKDHAPSGAPCNLVMTWRNQVYFTPDPARGGTPSPGLVGRLYLFGKDVGYPISGDGAVVVDLYDCTPLAQGYQPVLLEQWRIDKDTLQRLLHKDGIGWGYTLFLPWGTYRPELRNVQLRARFEQPGNFPLYAPIAQVMLQEDTRSAVAAMGGMPPPRQLTPPNQLAPPAPPTLPPPRPLDAPASRSFNLARVPDTSVTPAAGQTPMQP